MVFSVISILIVSFLSLSLLVQSYPVEPSDLNSTYDLLVIDWTTVKIGYLVPDDLNDYLREIDKDLKFTPSNTEPNSFNGNLPTSGKVPYQVGIALIDSSEIRWCSGALISTQFILTAAHCLDGIEKALVFLGAYNIQSQDEPGRIELVIDNKNVIIHEKYNRQDMLHDIALIKLPIVVSYSEGIQPIQLGAKAEEANMSADKLVVSGWSDCIKRNNRISKYLQYSENSVISLQDCQKRLGKHLPKQSMCIAHSYYQGDTGAPLILRKNGVGADILIGVNSINFNKVDTCESGLPTIFTDVSSYLGWIAENTGDRRFDKKEQYSYI